METDHGQRNVAAIQFTKIWDSCVVSHDQTICERDYATDGICEIKIYNNK